MDPAELNALLETALGLGVRLSETAVWHSGRCSWIGLTPAVGPGGARLPATARALGPDLYQGTSGIGLFLAHLHRATGDQSALRTGKGSLRHALGRASALPPDTGLALYTGALGVALAAVRSGPLLDDPDVSEGGCRLARALLVSDAPREPDLVAGAAGAVVGLLALGDALADGDLRERALAIGRSLAAAPAPPGLTGMAHGAAGSVHALLELHAATGDETFRAAAARHIAWERGRFDRGAANWPDLRPRDIRDAGDVGAASGMAWCHGAPGILLSRRRAGALAEEPDLALAARSVARWTRAAIESRRGNLSLCHGVAGNAEALWDAGRHEGAHPLALAVAEFGSEEFGRTGDPWPCGVPTGETPGLMLGLAGIGQFYLRLADPRIPSVLAIGPALTAG